MLKPSPSGRQKRVWCELNLNVSSIAHVNSQMSLASILSIVVVLGDLIFMDVFPVLWQYYHCARRHQWWRRTWVKMGRYLPQRWRHCTLYAGNVAYAFGLKNWWTQQTTIDFRSCKIISPYSTVNHTPIYLFWFQKKIYKIYILPQAHEYIEDLFLNHWKVTQYWE